LQNDEDEDDMTIGPLPPSDDADSTSYEQRLLMFQARNAIKVPNSSLNIVDYIVDHCGSQ
jgi:hypothetical protein